MILSVSDIFMKLIKKRDLFYKESCFKDPCVSLQGKNPDKPIQVVYVPSHLFHMLFELFKASALRSVT